LAGRSHGVADSDADRSPIAIMGVSACVQAVWTKCGTGRDTCASLDTGFSRCAICGKNKGQITQNAETHQP
jgi:hypothetical protein